MVLGYCSNCYQRYSAESYDVDVQHQCNSGNLALDQEDVGKIYGDNANLQGVNKLNATEGGIRGERLDNLTVRGNSASTNYQRQFVNHIELKPV